MDIEGMMDRIKELELRVRELEGGIKKHKNTFPDGEDGILDGEKEDIICPQCQSTITTTTINTNLAELKKAFTEEIYIPADMKEYLCIYCGFYRREINRKRRHYPQHPTYYI